jgi:GH35 family endo-1,4-beta-xylanase
MSLEEFWQRLAQYHVVWNMDQIKLLPAKYRDDAFFGINDALAPGDATAALMRGQGARFDRVEVRWDQVEPSPGEWQFDELDQIVQQARQWDLQILAVVVGAPTWAVDRPDRVGSGPPAALGVPPYLESGELNPRNPWTYFLATVARRYHGAVIAWEIWNEPNFRDFWHGTAGDYVQLYAASRAVLHRESPGAPVLIGGLVVDDGAFLRQVFAGLCPKLACGGQTVDAVGWHIYGNPDDVRRVASLTRELARPFRLDPAIWVTEANVSTADPLGPADAFVGAETVTLDQQAAFVIQLDALARSVGVQAVAFYRAVDVWENRRYWGLFRHDWSPRPALQAYQTAARWLSDTRYVATTQPFPNVIVVHFTRNGDDIFVVWSTDGLQRMVKIPIRAGRASVITVDGHTRPAVVRDGQVAISPPPSTGEPRATAPLASPIIVDAPATS